MTEGCRSQLRRNLGTWLVLLALVLGGCGPSTAVSIRGSVTYENQPVDPGSIVFIPEGTAKKLSASIVGGKYEIPADSEARPGTYRVEISWSKKTGKKLPSADPGFTFDETREAIPPQFNTQSTLSRDLAAGENVLDFALP